MNILEELDGVPILWHAPISEHQRRTIIRPLAVPMEKWLETKCELCSGHAIHDSQFSNGRYVLLCEDCLRTRLVLRFFQDRPKQMADSVQIFVDVDVPGESLVDWSVHTPSQAYRIGWNTLSGPQTFSVSAQGTIYRVSYVNGPLDQTRFTLTTSLYKMNAVYGDAANSSHVPLKANQSFVGLWRTV